MDTPRRRGGCEDIEERPGGPGARRSPGGLRGPVEAPHVQKPLTYCRDSTEAAGRWTRWRRRPRGAHPWCSRSRSVDGMKRWLATRSNVGGVRVRPHKGDPRSKPHQGEASHGTYWHRCAQEGNADLHPDRGRGADRTPGADPGRTLRRGAGPTPRRAHCVGGLDRERVGGAVSRGPGARRDRGRSQLRADVRHAHAEGEDRSAGCAGPDRGQRAGRLSAGAPPLGRPAACARAAGGPGRAWCGRAPGASR